MCEAYAEKRGYKTDRRGRADHHRAGAEIIRDSMDGVLPIFFYPPGYCGSYLDTSLNASYCGYDAVAKLNSEALAPSPKLNDVTKHISGNIPTGHDSENDTDVNVDESVAKKKAKSKAPFNAFGLLDDSSDESEENSDSD